MQQKRSRRSALKTLGAAAVAPIAAGSPTSLRMGDQRADFDVDLLRAIADAVLPEEIGTEGRARVVNSFLRWLRDYREGAETDHGYGFTRIRTTGVSPVAKYPDDLAALERAATAAKPSAPGARAFVSLSVDDRRSLIGTALAESKIDRLPQRPNGSHIAADLMGFYFNSSAAADLCYRVQIGRDDCRGLEGSEKEPLPLK